MILVLEILTMCGQLGRESETWPFEVTAPHLYAVGDGPQLLIVDRVALLNG